MNRIEYPRTDDSAIEQEIKAKGLTAPRVTPADMAANIKDVEYVKHVSKGGQVLRWAVITTASGYAVVGNPSVAVSPANDDEDIGQKVAFENSKQELWPLMGYALKDKLHSQIALRVVGETTDFPLGKACDLSGEGACESCQ